jgi:hypothetical protein
MIKLFRNIRQKLLSEGKTTNYLKYAIGEIVLVVIGILIALQVNNWNLDRIAKRDADLFNERLKEDLLNEKVILNERITYYIKVQEHAKNVVNTLSKQPNVLDSIFLVDVYQASQQWMYRNVRDTYDELISTGNINLIPNQNLRKRIGLHYDETDAYLRIWRGETDYRELARRYMPYDVQKKIREACEIWTEVDQQIGGNEILDDCNPNLTEEEITRSMAFLNSNNQLHDNTFLIAANRQVSDLELKIGLFKRKLNGNVELLNLLEEHKN